MPRIKAGLASTLTPVLFPWPLHTFVLCKNEQWGQIENLET